MKQYVYSVYDSKAAVFCTPFFCPVRNVALRAFAGAANDAESQMYGWPEDFSLWELGEFDDVTGEFVLYAQKINLGLAAAFKGVKTNVRTNASQQVGDVAQVQRGAEGGNSEVDVRPEPRS